MGKPRYFSQVFRIILPAENKKDFHNTVEKVFFADYRREKKKHNLNGDIQEGIVFEETSKEVYI